MGLPTGEIQTALIARYRGDTTLQGLLTGAVSPTWNIFDQGGVPTNQPFPYIVVFPIISQVGTALAFGSDSVDTFIQISIFTQAGGFSMARGIAKQVYKLTNQKELTLANGFNNFFVLFDNETETPQADGITQQIVHKYMLKTQG